jgi:lipopolysaccharide export system protein LptC
MLPFPRFSIRAARAVALAVGILAAPGCRSDRSREAAQVAPELKLEGVRFRVYRGEELRASGEAVTATLRRDSTRVTAQELVATLPREGAPVRIAATRGQGLLATRVFSATDGVVVSRGTDVARTLSARFEPSADGAGLVRGDQPVVVEGEGYRLEGPRFTLDPASGEIAIEGGARLDAGLEGTR